MTPEEVRETVREWGWLVERMVNGRLVEWSAEKFEADERQRALVTAESDG
jgi:hypothetical protein